MFSTLYSFESLKIVSDVLATTELSFFLLH